MKANRVGLIAGYGKLPLIWAKEAKKRNIEIHGFPVIEEFNTEIEDYVNTIDYISVTELGKLIDKIKNYNIDQVIMIGKVNKRHLFSNKEFDLRFKNMLDKMEHFNDDSILLKIVEELKNDNIEVIKQTKYIEDILVNKGLINNVKADQDTLNDMKYGFKMAKEIAGLDIGQTVLVKEGAVIAVEAIEGTDLAIKRTGELINQGAVMAKVSKPQQDFRFDVPTVGLDTIKNLIDISAKGLVVEAQRTLIVDKENVIKLADQNNLSIMSISIEEV